MAGKRATAARGRKGRPAWLRAMGTTLPPGEVEVAGRGYRHAETYKVDAFAVTCRYEREDELSPGEEAERVIVKFSRTQHAFGLPLRLLGRWLTGRERRLLQDLDAVRGVPRDLGGVTVAGKPWPNAAAREYLEGPTLMEHRAVDAVFFESLDVLVAEMHARRLAYVDLNKPDNIIVGADGLASLIDYQIHFALPRRWPWRVLLRPVLRTFQQADRYHLAKHRLRTRPDLFPGGEAALDRLRPASIRVFRRVWRVPMGMRRKLLVWLGVRGPGGRAETETPLTGD